MSSIRWGLVGASDVAATRITPAMRRLGHVASAVGDPTPEWAATYAAHNEAVTTHGPIRIGLNLPTWPMPDGSYARWPWLRALARDVEALGVDTLWAPDHLQRQTSAGARFGFWECWTIVTAAAEATSRIEIGPFVACAGFRNPALLAKMAATLDEVSGGRVILGLGSGVPEHDESWRAFGFDSGSHRVRFAEVVEIVARLLRERQVTVTGSHCRTEDAEIIPRGPRPDGIPIWVGAFGPDTARTAARWADAANVNVALTSLDDVRAIRDRMTVACAAVGRDPETITLTGWARLALAQDGTAIERPGFISGSPAEVAATVRSFAGAGLSHLTFWAGKDDDLGHLPTLTPAVLERFSHLLELIRA